MPREKADPVYNRQRRNTRRRLTGKWCQGKKIVQVGSPVDARFNKPTLIPVKLSNGSFRVLWEEKSRQLVPTSDKIDRTIARSQRMPLVGPGIGSDVVHIQVYPRRKGVKHAFIKVYFNEKADRGDSIVYVKEDKQKAA